MRYKSSAYYVNWLSLFKVLLSNNYTCGKSLSLSLNTWYIIVELGRSVVYYPPQGVSVLQSGTTPHFG